MAHASVHPFTVEADPSGPSVSMAIDPARADGWAVTVDLGTRHPYLTRYLRRTKREADELAGQIRGGNLPPLEFGLPDWLRVSRGTVAI